MVDKVEKIFPQQKFRFIATHSWKAVAIGKPTIGCGGVFLYIMQIWHSALIFFMSVLSSFFIIFLGILS